MTMFDVRPREQRGQGLPDPDKLPPKVTEGTPEAEAMAERHRDLMEMLEDESDLQADERYQMAKDHDIVDGLQWEPEDAEELIDRGQAPSVFNIVRPVIQWITGTEKRTRVDGKVLPREADDEQGAEVKTKLLKYLSDVNLTGFHRSSAFAEAVISGLGWLEDGINRDGEGELIYSGHVSWRDIIRDSRSREFDLSDARYIFRTRTVDLDVAQTMFPKARDAFASSDEHDDPTDPDDPWYLGEMLTNAHELDALQVFGERSRMISTPYETRGRRRRSVRLIEAWYRKPMPVEVFADGDLQGKTFNPAMPEHQQALAMGAKVFGTIKMQMRVMLCTKDMPLWDGPSPYKHNRFPFTPIWCYRRGRDGAPYGVVRDIRDPQFDFNKRRSKALYLLSSNRVVADNNAVDDIEQLRREASRPDGVVLKRPNTSLSFEKHTGEVAGNFELLQQDAQLVQEVSGVTGENLGRDTSATSGRAVLAKAEQGSMVTASIFDNHRLAVQLQGQIQLSLIEQFMSEARVVRIVGQNQPVEWLPVNTMDPETGQVINDITARTADFVVSEQEYRASQQRAAAEQMADLLGKMATFAPQAVLAVFDLWVDLLDLPNKAEIVARIRKINGQRDPAKRMTPEQQQAEAATQAAEAAAMQIKQRMDEAAVMGAEAKASSEAAQALVRRVQAMVQALEAGGMVATMPGITPIADGILAGAEQPGPMTQPTPSSAPPMAPINPNEGAMQ